MSEKEKKIDKKASKQREKSLSIAVVVLAVLSIFALPMAIFFMIDLCSEPDDSIASVEEYVGDVSEEYEQYEREEEEIENVLKEIRERMKKNDPYNYYGEIRYSTPGVYHKINDDGVLYKLDRSLSLKYPFGSEIFKERNMEALLDMGFSEYAHIDNDTYFNTIEEDRDNTYYTKRIEESGSEIVCVVGIFAVDCSNGNWKVDDEEYVVKVAEAYKKKTGQVIGPVVLKLQKEPNSKAEIIYVETDMFAVEEDLIVDGYYFYREFAGNSEWTYVGRTVDTQAGHVFYDCDELGEEVKEIFGRSYICRDRKNDGEFYYLDGSRFYFGNQP